MTKLHILPIQKRSDAMAKIKQPKKVKEPKAPKKAIEPFEDKASKKQYKKEKKLTKKIEKKLKKENKQLNKRIAGKLGTFAILLCILSSVLDIIERKREQ